MKLSKETKEAIGQEFTSLANVAKSTMESIAYAAPEMQQGWRMRMYQDIGDTFEAILSILEEAEVEE